MNQFRVIASIAVLAAAAGAGAVMAQAVNLDGSVSANSPKKPTIAATAASSLASANVPSTQTDLKAAADADLKKRNVLPHVQASRENLKGDAAKRSIAERQNPSTYDRDIQNGDIDHTEQVTDLKVTIKK